MDRGERSCKFRLALTDTRKVACPPVSDDAGVAQQRAFVPETIPTCGRSKASCILRTPQALRVSYRLAALCIAKRLSPRSLLRGWIPLVFGSGSQVPCAACDPHCRGTALFRLRETGIREQTGAKTGPPRTPRGGLFKRQICMAATTGKPASQVSEVGY